MRIDLGGRRVQVTGAQHEVATELEAALLANGGVSAGTGDVPDLAVISFPLLPDESFAPAAQLQAAAELAAAMAERGSGRMLCLASAAAAMPMRRHPRYSVGMAAVLATVRTLAMAHGPHVLVNALGVGAVGEPLLAGDAAMPGHASVARPGTVGEAVAAALFLCDPRNSYTTGQILCVDGGWAAGYGRNF